MQEVKDDLKAIRGHISEIKTTMAVMERDVAHHIKRTELAEELIRTVNLEAKLRISRIENWLLGLLSALVVGIIVAVVKLVIS